MTSRRRLAEAKNRPAQTLPASRAVTEIPARADETANEPLSGPAAGRHDLPRGDNPAAVTPAGQERTAALTPPRRLLYPVPEAATLLALSRSVVYELIRGGRLRSVTEGRNRFIPASALTDYVALLEQEAARGYLKAVS